MKRLVIILGILLFVLHQDCWFWTDGRLVFGFLPVGLAYHAAYSVVAALFWFMAIKLVWPSDVEEWADEPVPSEVPDSQAGKEKAE